MREYFDFVLCKFDGCNKVYLFYAPQFSHLKNGDVVTVETETGIKTANVIASAPVRSDDRVLIDFIMKATGAPHDVKRVVSRLEFKPLKYEEDL